MESVKLIRVDRNGTKYYEGIGACSRCGGLGGADAWAYTGWTCYKCGGTGKEGRSWKEYTPEYEAKLEERRKKKAEKYAKEHEAEIKAKQEEEARKEAERKAEEERIKEEKAKSQYIGAEGEKIQIEAVYNYSAHYETKSLSGYGMQTNYIHNFKAGDNVIIWKTTAPLGFEKNTKVTIKGTIKAHNEYKDEKQTILTRCKITEAKED